MSEWTGPTVADVAALLWARTMTDGSESTEAGSEVGTFTADTRPTAIQVSALIAQAVQDVSVRAGFDLSTQLHENARSVAAVRAAMLVELSYFPEQSNEENSTYAQLRDLYEEKIGNLIGAVLDGSAARKGMYSIPMRSESYTRYD